MRTQLHILTKPDDQLAAQIIRDQKSLREHEVKVIDFTNPETDYLKALEEIFRVDSVAIW